MKISILVNSLKNKAIKFSPEIFMGVGSVCVIAAGVIACKKTLKLHEVKEKNKDILDQIDEMEENGLADENVEYTPEDANRDRKIMKIKSKTDVIKLYSVPVGLAVVGFASIIWGHKILRTRNAALVAAYTAVDKGFKEYRKRVVDRFGEEVDKQLRFNTTTVEEKKKEKDENGKTKTLKTTRDVAYDLPNGYSDYARMYDDGCNGWSKNPEDSLLFLKREQSAFNNLLRKRTEFDSMGNVKKPGTVFLNEVYEALGIPKSKAGQLVGWTYNPDDRTIDNYIDFGIYDISKPKNGDFINGYESAIILDFNVDGVIIDRL